MLRFGLAGIYSLLAIKRLNDMKDKEKIARGWILFKSFITLSLTSFGCVILCAIILIQINIDTNSLIGKFLLIPLILIFCFSILWTTFWPCPRCRKPYATEWGTNIPFLKKCRHCGLPFGTLDIDNKI